MLEAAREADPVLFMISHWTLQSSFQKAELSIALEHRRFVPCIVHDDLGFQQLPPELTQYHVSKISEQILSEGGAARLQMLLDDVANVAMRGQNNIISTIRSALFRLLSGAKH